MKPFRDHIELLAQDVPQSVRRLRTLGRGRAATVHLVDATFADGHVVRCVEKVFDPGWLTRVIYRLCFAAPFAYRTNRQAILACFYRRRVVSRMLRETGASVRVAEPLYVRFDAARKCWVLAAEWIQGRGPRPALGVADPPNHDPSTTNEMEHLLGRMSEVEQQLLTAGLYGSGWQVAPKAIVSTANLLIRETPNSDAGVSHVIVDLESGIPAVLVPKYLGHSWRRGCLLPFDDLDADRLRRWQQEIEAKDSGSLAGLNAASAYGSLRDDVERLIRHTEAWKASEPASTRQPWRLLAADRRSAYRDETVRRWRQERRIDASTESGLRRNGWLWLLFWLLGLFPLSLGRRLQRLFERPPSPRRWVADLLPPISQTRVATSRGASSPALVSLWPSKSCRATDVAVAGASSHARIDLVTDVSCLLGRPIATAASPPTPVVVTVSFAPPPLVRSADAPARSRRLGPPALAVTCRGPRGVERTRPTKPEGLCVWAGDALRHQGCHPSPGPFQGGGAGAFFLGWQRVLRHFTVRRTAADADLRDVIELVCPPPSTRSACPSSSGRYLPVRRHIGVWCPDFCLTP